MSNFKWIWARLSKSKWYYVLIFLLMLVEMATNLSSIGIQKLIIDDVFRNGMYSKLPLVLGVFALIVVLDSALFTVVKTIIFKFKAKIRFHLISEFMNHYYRISLNTYRNVKNVKLIQIMTKDVDGIANVLGQRIPEGVQTFIKTAILIVTVGLTSPYLLLIVAVASPIYIFLGNYFSKRLKQVSKEKSDRRAEFLVQMEEGISSTREIIAFNRQQWEQDMFHRLFNKYYLKAKEDSHLANKQIMITGPLKWSVNLLVLAVLGYEVLQQTLSIGTFVVVYQFATQLIDSISETYGFIVGLSSSFASVERYREGMGFQLMNPGIHKLDKPVDSIQFESVRFQYQEDAPFVLKDISMSLPIGKKIAFVGTSGGGKSTIVQMLARLFEPTDGRILVNQILIDQIERKDWCDKVSIVFQEPYLFPDTVRNNITFGRSVSDEALMEVCKKAHIYDTIMSLPEGFDSLVGERGITLSGGQRQRIALARALLADSEILILDEATSALDVDTERQVQQNIDELRKGKTTIIIAHRLSTIENADIIYVLDQGRIVEQGTYTELVQNGPVFKKLVFEYQVASANPSHANICLIY